MTTLSRITFRLPRMKGVLLLLVIHCLLQISVKSDYLSSCPSQEAKEARKRLDDSLFKVINYWGYDIPTKCPLYKVNDLMKKMDQHKKRYRANKWQCKLCDKSFLSQEYLDNHLMNKHPDIVSPEGAVCLADYCDILQCPSSPFVKRLYSSLCDPSDVEARRQHCLTLLHSCFPPDNTTVSHNLHDLFSRQFCHHLSCHDKHVDDKLEKHHSTWSTWNTVALALGIVLTIILLVVYLAIYLWKKELHLAKDLRRISPTSNFNFRWNPFKTKIKGY
jgi:hypothetical protein